jgi:hypothetical protein
MSDFSEFLWAVINNWAGYATGGLVVATFWLYFVWKDKPMPRAIGFILAGAFLLMAFFKAWREQKQTVAQRDLQITMFQKQIDSLTKPDFELTAGTFVISTLKRHWPTGKGATGKRTDEVIFVPLSILNHGAPSVVSKFRMSVSFQGGETVQGIPLVMADSIVLPPPNSAPITFTPDQSLFKKAVAQPIPTGGIVGGFVLFLFPEEFNEQLRSAGTVISIVLEDSVHREYKVDLKSGQNPAGIGMSVPSVF